MSADHLGHVAKYLGKPVGIVLFVDILDIILLLALALGIADVVNIEAERFCKVVEAVQSDLIVQICHHVPFAPGSYGRNIMSGTGRTI